MSISVGSHFLYSIKEQSGHNWRNMICEFIDNSFGAGAKKVTIAMPGDKTFSITDDGCGTNDLNAMLTLGGKRDRESGDIGYYGVGAKQAMIWLWGESKITSVRNGKRYSVKVDWENIARDIDRWPTRKTISTTAAPGLKSGTKIECTDIERKLPKIDLLAGWLSETYAPAIENGRQIRLILPEKNDWVSPRQWPKTSSEINDVIQVAGRSVRIRMGVVAPNETNPFKRGFAFERSFRVIKDTSLGSKHLDTSRIAGRVILGDDWLLSTNKDDFREYNEEIEDAIYERCEPMFAKASEQAMVCGDDQFNKELADIVTGATGKEQRLSDGELQGTISPANSGRKRLNASRIHDDKGSASGAGKKKSSRGFYVSKYCAEDNTMGYYDEKANKLFLNMSNKALKEAYDKKDHSTVTIVMYGILCSAALERDSKESPLLKNLIRGDFCGTWGEQVAMKLNKESK